MTKTIKMIFEDYVIRHSGILTSGLKEKKKEKKQNNIILQKGCSGDFWSHNLNAALRRGGVADFLKCDWLAFLRLVWCWSKDLTKSSDHSAVCSFLKK